MAAPHQRVGGIRFSLPVLIFPVICGLALLGHFQVRGQGQAFSAWLVQTYGLRHGPTVSRMLDGWAAAMFGAARPATVVAAATGTRGGIARIESVVATPREIEDPRREIRRLLAGRPERGLMSDDFAAARLALARELAEAAGLLEEPAAPAKPGVPSPAIATVAEQPETLLIQTRTIGEQAAIRAEIPMLPTAEPISLGPDRKRIFVHHSKHDPRGAEIARRIAEHLRNRGYVVADIRSVPYPVKKSSIRFFFADDADAAAGLRPIFAAGLDAAGINASDLDIKDFQHYRPHPNRGTIEVWIPLG